METGKDQTWALPISGLKDSIGSRAEIKGVESLIPSNIYSILVTMIYVCELLIQRRQGAQSGNRWM
jgi:hypothetical protein